MIFYKKNLLQSFGKLDAPEVNAGGALVFLGIFAFLMALFFPVLRQVLLAFTSWIKLLSRTEGKEINHDFRDTSTARREALIHRDKLIVELLDKHEAQRRDHETNMNIAFGLVLMFAVNFLNLGTSQVLSLTQTAATLPGTITGFWVNALIVTALVTFTAFLLAILAMSLAPEISDKIYLPESDEEKATRLEREKKMKLPSGVYLG
ncbi:ABC-type sugar transport system permease subunit [Pseudomonas sp. PvR086]